MEEFTQALWALAAVIVTSLTGIIVIALPLVRAYLTNLLQQRLGAGAARVAGEIAAQVAADPNVTAATTRMVQAGVAAMKERFPDTATKVEDQTLFGMVAGEIGKLGVGVTGPKPPTRPLGQ